MSAETIQQDLAFEKIATKGLDDGLFQSSMRAIRRAHFHSNRLRAGLVLAGVFTDRRLYREVLSLFYVVTKDLERKLEAFKDQDGMCRKILTLGYHFTDAYEQDLSVLYDPLSWKDEVEQAVKKNAAAQLYRDKISTMTRGTELAGATFVLWGALIIGGGAAIHARIQKLCGKQATHLFEGITGPGRVSRRNSFIRVWDSLAANGTDDYCDIVRETQECMQCNNDIFASLQRDPWWLQYIGIMFAMIVAFVLYRWIH